MFTIAPNATCPCEETRAGRARDLYDKILSVQVMEDTGKYAVTFHATLHKNHALNRKKL